MSEDSRERERGPSSRLRFERAEKEEGTSGQVGPKSKPGPKGRKRIADTPADPKTTPPISDTPAPPGTAKGRLRFEAETPPDGVAPPPKTAPATSGQLGPKSYKLRQDSEKAQPSERLQREGETPPGGKTAEDGGAASHDGPGPADKKAAQNSKRIDKSKFRVEESGDKLNNARDKLAKQKPPKKPGIIKKVGRAAKYQAWKYTHGKINQVEHENVGIEAAHKTELAGEKVVRGGTRFIRRRIRTRPARQVRKWEKKNSNAKADYAFRQLKQENPSLQSNPISRFFQKQKLKKQYRKQTREATKQGVKVAKKTIEKIAGAVWGFIKRNPKVFLIVAALFLVIVILQSCMAAAVSIGNGLIGAVGGTSYVSTDSDIETAEANYTALETALRERLARIESDYPSYDEYRYSVDEIGHDPFELASYLTAKYDDYTPAEVQAELQYLIGQQYTLTITQTVEIRYRTEYYTDEDGHEHSRQVAYNYYILNVSLRNHSLGAAALANLDPEQTQRYLVYQQTKGNRRYLFEDNIYTHPGEYTDYDIPPEALSDPAFAAMIAEGEKYLGYPYVWGGSSPSTSFDCSGFVCWVINHSGVGSVGRTTATGLFNHCAIIPPGEARPGDLIFFQGTYDTPGASHVGIYVGNGMMLHCGSPIQYTSINTSYWQSHFLGYGRLP